MRAQSQGTRRHRSPEGERRGRCSERGRERDGISQTNLATVLKATQQKLLRNVVGRVIVFFRAHRYHLELSLADFRVAEGSIGIKVNV